MNVKRILYLGANLLFCHRIISLEGLKGTNDELLVFYLNGIHHLHEVILEDFISLLLIVGNHPLSPIISFF